MENGNLEESMVDKHIITTFDIKKVEGEIPLDELTKWERYYKRLFGDDIIIKRDKTKENNGVTFVV